MFIQQIKPFWICMMIVFNLAVPIIYSYSIMYLHVILQSQFVQGSLLSVAGKFMLISVIMQLLHIGSSFSISKWLPQLIYNIKNKIVHKIYNISPEFMYHNNSVAAVIDKYISTLSQLLEIVFIVWMPIAIDILVTIIFAWNIGNIVLSILVITWLIIIGGTIFITTTLNYKAANNITENAKQEQEFLNEQTNNILLVKMNDIRGEINDRFAQIAMKSQNSYSKFIQIIGINKFSIGVMNICLYIVCLYLSNMLLPIKKDLRALCFNMLWTMTKSIWNMISNSALLLNKYDEYKKASHMLNTLPQQHIHKGNDLHEIQSISGVQYILPSLRKIDFHIEDIGLTVIIGATGSGKSSLLLNMCGIYSNCQGLRINGSPLQSYNSHSVTNNFVVSLQNDFVYNMSLEYNIALSKSIDSVAMRQAMQSSGLNTANINHSLCGVNGSLLSGGQRKLLAITRVLYKIYTHKTRLVIILDEPLNHLDTKRSAMIVDLIRNLSQSHIVICTDHTGLLMKHAKDIINIESNML